MDTCNRCRYCAELSIEVLVHLAKDEFRGREFPQRAYYQHHASIQDLEQSAEDGCDLCHVIIEGCKRFDQSAMEWMETRSGQVKDTSLYTAAQGLEQSDVKIAIDSSQLLNHDPLSTAGVLDLLQVQIGPNDDEDYVNTLFPLYLTLCASKDEQCTVQGFRIGRLETEPHLGNEANFSLVEEWLKECRHVHQSCKHLGSSNPLPTRVVNVGSSTVAPRLVHSDGIEAPYLALSHCWGGDIAVKLTLQTLSSYQRKLPDSLPANFNDAITITRRLGIEYLWIDSLCIIQDSREDWQKEAARMEAVYRQATLVIYAMSAHKSTIGILHKTPEPRALSFSIKLKVVTSSSETSCVCVDIYNPEEETLSSLHLKSPLSKRGWALQELALAPRRLLYGAQQIYWECLHGCRSAQGQPRKLSDYFAGLQKYLSTDATVDRETVDMLSLLNEYYELATVFSERKLTKASDKLIAMAGMIQRLHPIIGGKYLAGIWSNDITSGLIWRAQANRCPHVQVYRGPSWSWVSTDESVQFHYGRELRQPTENDMHLVEHSITLVDERSPYGQVAAASLTILALTLPLIRSRQTARLEYLDSNVIGQVFYDAPEIESLDREPFHGPFEELIVFTKDDQDRWVLVTLWRDRDHPKSSLVLTRAEFSNQEYKAAIIEGGTFGEDGVGKFDGIILQRCNSTPEVAYERVGYFNIDVSAQKLKDFKRETLTLV